MKLDQALECLGQITQVGFGWTDEIVTAYVDKMRDWPDGDAACEACEVLALEWNKTTRIPLGVIRERYETIVHLKRRDAMGGLPEAPGTYLPPSQGYPIAKREYEKECRRQGREPNWKFFDAIFGNAVATGTTATLARSVDEDF